MAIHILHEMAKEVWEGQFSSMGEENELWSQANLTANPSSASSKLLNLSDTYFPNLQKRKSFSLLHRTVKD